MAKIKDELLRLLVCPVSKKPLVESGDWLYSTDPSTRRRYPIRDGLPIMLVDESEVVEEKEFERIVAQAKSQAAMAK